MRITIELTSDQNRICLPFRYPEFVQAMIYRSLTPQHAEKLHNEGFLHGKRPFKLFTFSRILGKRVKGKNVPAGMICFSPPVKLHIASPVSWLLPEMADHLLRVGEISLGSEKLLVKSIMVCQRPAFQPPLRIRMLSPVTIYSTLTTSDGRKKTYFYHPTEKEFSALLSENARKKHQLLYHTSRDGAFQLVPISRPRENPVIFKGTFIRAWSGVFEMDGDVELIQVTYDCGLGAKNSQGFGMWEVVAAKD